MMGPPLLQISDFETGKVFCDYFTKVFNNARPTDDSGLDIIAHSVKHWRNFLVSPPLSRR